MSKVTRNLSFCISFFPNYSLFQDLTTNKITGKGHEYGGLYILDAQIPRSITFSRGVTTFEAHCQFDHHSLSVLRKVCPRFESFSSLECESC